MNIIVVARFKEDTSWMLQLPPGWQHDVVQKDRDIPNIGREPLSFIWNILKNYHTIQDDDLYCFVQGWPFDHCPDLIEQLYTLTGKHLSSEFKYAALGAHWHNTDGQGRPAHGGLPVAHYYEEWFGKPFPATGVEFVAGGQYLVSGGGVKARNKDFYQMLYDDILADPDRVPWVLERLWSEVFSGEVH